ncbi:MAG: hypothetical protein R3Y33_05715 [Clostridia bacterium]
MIDRNLFRETILNFVKENSKILAINDNKTFDNFLPLSLDLRYLIDLKNNDYVKQNEFDIVILENQNFVATDISLHLKKGGHFVTMQKEIDELPSFNLENIVEHLEDNSFRIVKCDQDYDEKGKNIFYILAKK